MPESPSLTAFAVRAVESEISLATPQTVINAATVLASPVSSFFQLDGDTTSGLTAGGGHDWDQVYSDFMRYTTNAGGTNAINFYTDPILNDDSLTGGNSKDTSDLNAWTYGLSTPQNKANLEHAIAASYVDPGNGHTYMTTAAQSPSASGSSKARLSKRAGNSTLRTLTVHPTSTRPRTTSTAISCLWLISLVEVDLGRSLPTPGITGFRHRVRRWPPTLAPRS